MEEHEYTVSLGVPAIVPKLAERVELQMSRLAVPNLPYRLDPTTAPMMPHQFHIPQAMGSEVDDCC